MNVILIVVDSLRFDSAADADLQFFRRLDAETVSFGRAYATECWTLPSHTSMFTGLLPSEHGAHFQSMGYLGQAPTIAEVCRSAGLHTEIVTRNSVFDGTLPGTTRGFDRNVRLESQRPLVDPLSLMLAASKPRFRRQIRSSGFFHPAQRRNRRFIMDFARAMLPADRRTLSYVATRADHLRAQRRPFFLFANLYDVHAPYAPQERSILSPFWSLHGMLENSVMLPFVLPRLGGHQYLAPGFRLAQSSRTMLQRRYRRAVALMDRKLGEFYDDLLAAGILDDTLLIITSDHGEAFGDHDLYLHDASVFDTHLHVPLWIRHPEHPAAVVHDVVSTRHLFGLMRRAALGDGCNDTLLDAGYRRANSVALAEHFFYPHCPAMDAKFRTNQAAVISSETKVVSRGRTTAAYDVTDDPDENEPHEIDMSHVNAALRRASIPAVLAQQATDHLARCAGM